MLFNSHTMGEAVAPPPRFQPRTRVPARDLMPGDRLPFHLGKLGFQTVARVDWVGGWVRITDDRGDAVECEPSMSFELLSPSMLDLAKMFTRPQDTPDYATEEHFVVFGPRGTQLVPRAWFEGRMEFLRAAPAEIARRSVERKAVR